MENTLQTFTHEQFGTVHCYLDADGVVQINVEESARGLGFSFVAKSGNAAVRWVRVNEYLKSFGYDKTVGRGDYIPENMFYRLAMKANSATAERFQEWIANDVLPNIRRHGFYMTPDALKNLTPQFLRKLAEYIEEVDALKAKTVALEETVAVQSQQIAELTPKASYYDLVLSCKNAVPITIIAKDYGMNARQMNNLLHELGIQHKVHGVWVLYTGYQGRNWTKMNIHVYVNSDGEKVSAYHTCWTQQGRLAIYDLLKDNGYLPNIEQGR